MFGRQLRLAPCEAEHFTFTLKTDALTHASIPEGSRLLACPDTKADDGDLVAVETPHGELLRFVTFRGEAVILDTYDPEIPPLILPACLVNILGVVCTILS